MNYKSLSRYLLIINIIIEINDKEHGKGFGGKILSEGIKIIKKEMNIKKIYIEAQKYAIGFYEREGFKVCSQEFLEDGIPHVQMELIL